MDGVSAIDTKRPTRMVVVGYLLSTVSVGLFLESAFGAIFAALRWNDANIVGDWTLSSLLGAAVAVAIALGCYFHPRVNKLSYEVAVELKKSTWPNAEDTRTSTIAVVLFSVLSAAVLGIFDFVSSKIMTQWLPTALDAISRHV